MKVAIALGVPLAWFWYRWFTGDPVHPGLPAIIRNSPELSLLVVLLVLMPIFFGQLMFGALAKLHLSPELALFLVVAIIYLGWATEHPEAPERPPVDLHVLDS